MSMKRPDIMSHHRKWPRKLLRFWQQYEAMALEVTFHHPNDTSQTEWEIRLPHWPWRMVCWIQGHHPYGNYGKDQYCIICHQDLGDPTKRPT